METWRQYIGQEILPLVSHNTYWTNCLRDILIDLKPNVGIHLAIFVEPYLSFVLSGKKTVESRFGRKRQSPYGQVVPGDILLLKKSGGAIIGLCEVANVWFYTLDKDSWKKLRKEFTISLCAQDPEFWQQRESATFATLMQIKSVMQIPPVDFPKTDRRGWVVLRRPMINSFL